MNDLDYLETRLREWKPRRPSADLKSRIFGREQILERPSRFAMGDIFRWAIPAMACSLLALANLAPRSQQTNPAAAYNLLAQSNAYSTPFLAQSASHSEQNNIPATRVEARWWNAAEPKADWVVNRSTSVAAQVIQFYTNKLIR